MKIRARPTPPQAPQMWRATQSLTACGIVTASILAIGMMDRAPLIAAHTCLIVLNAGVGQVLLWLNRRSRPQLLASWIYLGNILTSIVTVTLNHEYFIHANVPFAPFIGIKMTAAIVALQTPAVRWVGWVSLAIMAICPMIQFYHWPPEIRYTLGSMEPWITLSVVICAGFIYYHRLQVFEMFERKAKLEAAAAELRRFAHLLLGAQHLTNTPLQVIESTTQLIRDQHPEAAPLVQKIEKAFIPIQHISQLMSFGKSHISWEDVQLPSSVEDFEKEVHLLAKELAQNRTLFNLHAEKNDGDIPKFFL